MSSVYDRVPAEDVMARPAEALYGAALGLWKFAERRPGGAAKVRVYNPGIAEHGWTSPHTIVDIVNDDMPFLVDSVSAEIERRELRSHLIVHPTVCVHRDDEGRRVETTERDPDGQMESVIHLEIDAQSAPEVLEELCAGIETVLADVRAAVEGWEPTRAALREAIVALDRAPPPLPAEERAEVVAFLEWIGADHFTFLGFRDYDYRTVKSQTVPRMVAGSGLGILRDRNIHVLRGRRGPGRDVGRGAAFPRRPGGLDGHQGRRAVHGASPRPYGLHRAQEVRPRRPRLGRAPVHRPVHLGRLQPHSERHPLPQAQGRPHARARRVRSREP